MTNPTSSDDTRGIILAHYTISKVIGSGGSGIVFLGENIRMKALGITLRVALKLVWTKEMALDEARRLAKLQNEVGIVKLQDMIQLSSKDLETLAPLIKHYEQMGFQTESNRLSVTTEGNYMLVMEYLDARPLLQYRAKGCKKQAGSTGEHWQPDDQIGSLDTQARLDMLVQLAKRLRSLHQQGMVHGDLNPFNVLYNHNAQSVKLIDFGFNETNLGMEGWRTPEHIAIYRGTLNRLPEASDIYGLGLWIATLLGRNLGSLRGLVNQCCHQDPEKRPNIDQIISALMSAFNKPKRKRLMTVAIGTLLFTLLVYLLIVLATSNRVPVSLLNADQRDTALHQDPAPRQLAMDHPSHGREIQY